MSPQELQNIIGKSEGRKLDFKSECHLDDSLPPNTKRQDWDKYINGQWDEFIRDVLAVTNGNVNTANEVGLLIIGVGNTLYPDKSRDLFDTVGLSITPQQILNRVNNACHPPIPDVEVEKVTIQGKVITVISIPSTPFVHETTRQLETTKGEFDETGDMPHFLLPREVRALARLVKCLAAKPAGV